MSASELSFFHILSHSCRFCNVDLDFLAVLAMPKHNEDYLSAGEELNQLCEDVLAKCPIQKYRYNAIYHLCGAATATNNRERAMELAKAMPKQYQCQEELLKRIGVDFES